ncbi:hypothetical protein XAC2852_320015 [Xanthomonas citri pv. citri]|nr:hypothetical protein XAC2852_320015 [Xanthomonas citri pv. citri]
MAHRLQRRAQGDLAAAACRCGDRLGQARTLSRHRKMRVELRLQCLQRLRARRGCGRRTGLIDQAPILLGIHHHRFGMIVVGDHHCPVRAHLAHQAGPALHLDVGSGGFFELGQILEARHGEIRGGVLAISLLSNSQFRKFVHFVQTMRSTMPSKTKRGPQAPFF